MNSKHFFITMLILMENQGFFLISVHSGEAVWLGASVCPLSVEDTGWFLPLTTMGKAAVNARVGAFVWTVAFLLGICRGVELLDHMPSPCLPFRGPAGCFPKQPLHLPFPPAASEGLFPPILAIPVTLPFYHMHPGGFEVASHGGAFS